MAAQEIFCLTHRFLFILLGPQAKEKAYHEVGRAMATLLTDEVSLVHHPWVVWAGMRPWLRASGLLSSAGKTLTQKSKEEVSCGLPCAG